MQLSSGQDSNPRYGGLGFSPPCVVLTPRSFLLLVKIELFGQEPPIVKLDSALGTLKACK